MVKGLLLLIAIGVASVICIFCSNSSTIPKYSSRTPLRFCVDGHEFISVKVGFGTGLAQHIGDDGLPVKCKIEGVGG